jgi:hypothetical protein
VVCRVRRATIRTWRHKAPGLFVAEQLLGLATHEGDCDELVTELVAYVENRRSARARHAYGASVLLFSMSGRWPVSRVQRPHRARAYEGLPTEPPPPPPGMSDVEIERVRRQLERKNWTLITRADGVLMPVRTI